MPDGDDYRVYIVSLPVHVRGCIRLDADGFASIYINASLSRSEQYAVLGHELKHLRRNDMYSTRSIRQVERRQRKRR
ncbi:MAG: M48 family metalloprotease [Verrucomicrobia bacterium]|nr:M48 family metalloprotease [Verrucomicrobiota bacterium]